MGLFVDISGFSRITDTLMEHGQHGAEVLAIVIRSAFEPLLQAVFEQGGFVISQAGDAFTTLFPALEGQAPPELRAMAAAWDIQQRAAQRPVYSSPYGDFNISVKVGAAMGEVTWGIIPSNDNRKAAYYFQGSAIDSCSEAEHFAGMGEVILDQRLRTALGTVIDVDDASEYFRLKSILGDLPAASPFTPPDVDLDLAGRFFPRELFTQQLVGEFRQVAYLFVRLPTVRTEDQLRIFMQSVFDLQDQYGGMMELLFGDKGAHLLLFWGAPVAHENDAERALNFILDLQARTAIPVNGGVAYRVGHAGFIGSELAEEYTAYGRGVNLAARFMTSAARGEIWVDENVARLAGQRFEMEFVGEQRFKGFSQPQKVYTLLERKEEIEVVYEGNLVGRESELEQLRSFVQPIFQKAYPGLLVVWGEPGMGKSRLVHEFLKSLKDDAPEEFQIFLAQTDEILRQPLNPFRYWLHQYFNVSEAQGEARNKRSFNRKLDKLLGETDDERLANELDRTRSFLGALVGLRWPDSLYEELDPKARYENTFIGLASLLQVESLRQPVIFFLEDLHWLDADSEAFLLRLMRTLTAETGKNYPIALLTTSRFEGVGLPLEGYPYQEIHLDRIDREALASLVSASVEGNAAPGLMNLLEERSGGNPFFAGQILSYILENDLLQRTGDGWTVTSSQRVTLPDTVGAVLVARLDRMEKPVKEVVQTASVLGREFELRLLAHMLPDDPALNEKVTQAEQELVWSPLGIARYYFRHFLMRDAAYMMQTHARLATLHARALQAVEASHDGELEEHYGELAYHAEQAGDIPAALRYLRLAGFYARGNYQNVLAIDYFTRALALLPKDEIGGRYELLLAREEVYDILGKLQERKDDLDALEALPWMKESEIAEVRLRQANLSIDTGQYAEANALTRQTIVNALDAEDYPHAVAAYLLLASSLLRSGKSDVGIHQARQGLILARRMRMKKKEGQLLNIMGMLVLEQGKVAEAGKYFSETLKIADERNDLRLKVMPLNNIGMVLVMQGEFEGSRDYYEQCLEATRKIGDRSGEGLVLGNLSFVAGIRGEYEKARDFVTGQLRIAREVGDRNSEMYGWINLSGYLRGLEDFKAAQEAAENGLKIGLEVGDRSGQAWALTNLGHAHLESGERAQAEADYREALAIRRDLEQPALASEPLAGLARLTLIGDDSNLARGYVQEILAHLDGGGTLEGTDDPLRVYLTCFNLLQKMGEARAGEVLEKAYRLLQQNAASIPEPDVREMYLKQIPHHREILEAWERHPV